MYQKHARRLSQRVRTHASQKLLFVLLFALSPRMPIAFSCAFVACLHGALNGTSSGIRSGTSSSTSLGSSSSVSRTMLRRCPTKSYSSWTRYGFAIPPPSEGDSKSDPLRSFHSLRASLPPCSGLRPETPAYFTRSRSPNDSNKRPETV